MHVIFPSCNPLAPAHACNQFRALKVNCIIKVLSYCLLEKQLQMLLTRGPPASHTRPPHGPSLPSWPTSAPLPAPLLLLTPSWFPGRLLMDWSRRCPHTAFKASAQVARMASTSAGLPPSLPTLSSLLEETDQQSQGHQQKCGFPVCPWVSDRSRVSPLGRP